MFPSYKSFFGGAWCWYRSHGSNLNMDVLTLIIGSPRKTWNAGRDWERRGSGELVSHKRLTVNTFIDLYFCTFPSDLLLLPFLF